MLQGRRPCQTAAVCPARVFVHVMSTPVRFEASAATISVVVLNPFAVLA